MKVLVAIVCMVACPLCGSAFVKLDKQGDDWRFSSDAERFLSLGINGIRMAEYWPAKPEYESRKAGGYYDVRDQFSRPYGDWVDAINARMSEWGFNTAGAWSSQLLERAGTRYCHILRMGWSRSGEHKLVDLFSQEYEAYADAEAKEECAPRASHQHLLGYFVDNELPWYGAKSWRTKEDSLLTRYNKLAATSPGRGRLMSFLRSQFSTWEEFTANFATDGGSWSDLESGSAIQAWSAHARAVEDAWAGVVAERFFSVASNAISKYDPNHLILGSRFAANAPIEVWKAAGRHCDVLSVNFYTGKRNTAIHRWREVFQLTQKPILISETSVRSSENRSGNPNTVGADCTVCTQEERAAHVQFLLSAWLKEPYIVGIHWFEYFDQPPRGRYNREDSNFGLVDIHDKPYTEVIEAWREASRSVDSSRAAFAFAPVSSPSIPRQAQVSGSANRRNAWTPDSSTYHNPNWDKDGGGKSGVKILAGSLHWRIDTAQAWHPFLTLKSNAPAGSEHSRYLSVRVKSAEGRSFKIRLCESAQQRGPHVASDEAECYVSPPLFTDGTEQAIILPLSAFFLDDAHDSARGNKIIDIRDTKRFDVILTKNQGLCDIQIFQLEWLAESSTDQLYKAPRQALK